MCQCHWSLCDSDRLAALSEAVHSLNAAAASKPHPPLAVHRFVLVREVVEEKDDNYSHLSRTEQQQRAAALAGSRPLHAGPAMAVAGLAAGAGALVGGGAEGTSVPSNPHPPVGNKRKVCWSQYLGLNLKSETASLRSGCMAPHTGVFILMGCCCLLASHTLG